MYMNQWYNEDGLSCDITSSPVMVYWDFFSLFNSQILSFLWCRQILGFTASPMWVASNRCKSWDGLGMTFKVSLGEGYELSADPIWLLQSPRWRVGSKDNRERSKAKQRPWQQRPQRDSEHYEQDNKESKRRGLTADTHLDEVREGGNHILRLF